MSQYMISGFGGGGAGPLLTLTGNTGGAIAPVLGNINLVGSGSTTVTGSGNTLTISVIGGGLPWTVITAASQAMAVNNGYIANNSGTINFSLPATAAVGSILRITGINNALGWQITQGVGQQIFIGAASSSSGVGGSLSSTATRDSIELVCVVANTTYNAISFVGNIAFV